MSTNDKPTSAEEALGKAERTLQFEQDKRVQDAAMAAGVSTDPEPESEPATPPPSTAPAAPTEDEIRGKAYVLWQQGGCRDGGDKDDWFKAAALLSADRKVAAVGSGDSQAPSIAEAVSDGMQSVAALATVAVQAFTGLFGASGAEKKPH